MKKIIIICCCLLIICAGTIAYFLCNYSSKLIPLEKIKTDSKYINVAYNVEEDVTEEDVLGVLTIEKINLVATVKEGSTSDVLKNYIGHIESTNTYDGNIGLAAHNRGNKYSYFARLNELEIGDVITYKTKFCTRQYEVNNVQVIFETDWSLLEKTTENKLTMITCITNKRNQRLCVQAVEIN